MLLSPSFFGNFFKVVIQSGFIWAPIILGVILRKLWLYLKLSEKIQSLDWVLLEIKLPREIDKSPKAMEVILNTFQQAGKEEWFSLEMISIGGEIHFFIRTLADYKNMVEAQIYGQFPDSEIFEIDDYTKMYFTNGFGSDWTCWGAELKLSKEDAYPIKTYVDYGLHDTSLKEEQKIDPMTSLIELMGSLREREHIWIQILVKPTKSNFEKDGKELIDKLMKRDKENPPALSPGEQSIVEAVEKCISKMAFDVGVRIMYLADNEKFNKVNSSAMTASFKQYNSLNLNGFKTENVTKSKGILFGLFKGKMEAAKKLEMLNAYRRRSYFYTPHERKAFVLNTEELATIYHFPGGVAETPTLGRIEAKKSEAPANLPI